MSRPPRIVVIGLGNPDRGDDGAGSAVATLLVDRLPAGAQLLNRRGDMLALLDDWAGADALVCIDAAAPMGRPGHIHRIDLDEADLPRTASAASSHALGLADAVALARALGTAPRKVIVFAIEGTCFDGGAPLTPEVAAALDSAATQVLAETAALLAGEVLDA